MVSAYDMFAAFVDLVVGTVQWITWPFFIVTHPLRIALLWIFGWWSYFTKVFVYGTLNTILWPYEVVTGARREKETRNQLLVVQHQLLQATAIAKDLNMKFEVAVEEKKHAHDALETCVEEKKRLKNKFHQAQVMLRKMDIERRRAWELAGSHGKEAAEHETVVDPIAVEGLATGNMNSDRQPPLSPELAPSIPASDLEAHQLFATAELENGHPLSSAHEELDLPSLRHRSNRARRESEDGGSNPRASDHFNGRESLGALRREGGSGRNSRRESFATGGKRDSFGPGPRRESNVSADVTGDGEGEETSEDGGASVISTVVQCGLIGWTLIVLGASTAAIMSLFIIIILPTLVGQGKDAATQTLAEYVGSLKWFVLGFVFCYYMETEEFSWFKQGLESIPRGDGLLSSLSS